MMTDEEEFRLIAKNVNGDAAKIATYTYQKCCEYMGGDHEKHATAFIQHAIEASVAQAKGEGHE